jgi:hypothetical protein
MVAQIPAWLTKVERKKFFLGPAFRGGRDVNVKTVARFSIGASVEASCHRLLQPQPGPKSSTT